MLTAEIEDQPCFVGKRYTTSAIQHSPGLDSFPTIRNGSKPLSHFHQHCPGVTHCPGEQQSHCTQRGRGGKRGETREQQEVAAQAEQAFAPERAPRQGRSKAKCRAKKTLSSPALTPSCR